MSDWLATRHYYRLYAWWNGWRWVGWYLRRRRLVAASRQFWLAYIRGNDGEACQVCGRSYQAMGWWWSPGPLWEAVTGGEDGGGGLYCPDCFGELAHEQGFTLAWHPEIALIREVAE